MPYAIVGPGVSGVYYKWDRVEELASLFPYCKYRKFKTEDECWDFVNRYKSSRVSLSMTKYGNTFDNLFIRMFYIVTPSKLYWTFNTERFGNIRLDEQEGLLISYFGKGVLVSEATSGVYDNQTVISHILAISRGVEILGDLVDVDIVLPDHSIYYALTKYTGEDETILRVQQQLKDRLAEVSYTLKDTGGD